MFSEDDIKKLLETKTAKNPKGITADAPTYIGVKAIRAIPMTRKEYNDFRMWELPEDENGEDAGYLVEYLDDGTSNVRNIAGYVSWSPKEVFDKHYKPFLGI